MSKKKVVKTIVKKKVITKDKAGDKVSRVIQEYKDGKLKSSSGQVVTDKKQALAIALNEAGLSKSIFKSFEKVDILNKVKVMKSILEKKVQKEQAQQDGMDGKILSFIMANPNPEDSKIHGFAEKEGFEPEQIEERIYAILSSFISGGKSQGKKVNIDMAELKKGIQTEMEHTSNKILAGKIATDHLVEIPDYYTRLAKMEAEAKGRVSKSISDKEVYDDVEKKKDWGGEEYTTATAVRG